MTLQSASCDNSAFTPLSAATSGSLTPWRTLNLYHNTLHFLSHTSQIQKFTPGGVFFFFCIATKFNQVVRINNIHSSRSMLKYSFFLLLSTTPQPTLPSLLPRCMLFQWGPLCMKIVTYFWKLKKKRKNLKGSPTLWRGSTGGCCHPYVGSQLQWQTFGMRRRKSFVCVKETQCCRDGIYFPKPRRGSLSCVFFKS